MLMKAKRAVGNAGGNAEGDVALPGVVRHLCRMTDQELGFTDFLAEPSKRRLRALLEAGPHRRKDVRALLDHHVTLDPRFAHPLQGSIAGATAVEAMLREHGAPSDCHLLSADAKLDGRTLSLRDAVAAVSGSSFGGFISCIAGRLGYFEHEDIKSAQLLRK